MSRKTDVNLAIPNVLLTLLGKSKVDAVVVRAVLVFFSTLVISESGESLLGVGTQFNIPHLVRHHDDTETTVTQERLLFSSHTANTVSHVPYA